MEECNHTECISKLEEASTTIRNLTRSLNSLRFQVEIFGCAVAHSGELTRECDATKPCGLCIMNSKIEALESECLELRTRSRQKPSMKQWAETINAETIRLTSKMVVPLELSHSLHRLIEAAYTQGVFIDRVLDDGEGGLAAYVFGKELIPGGAHRFFVRIGLCSDEEIIVSTNDRESKELSSCYSVDHESEAVTMAAKYLENV